MKVVSVFVDGLKPESVRHMAFLNGLNMRRIKTELGYSNPCHASMYSGVYPNKHLIWFIWKYSPQTSPFRWLKKTKLDRIPHNIYTKYICYRMTRLVNKKNSSAFGLPFLWYMPITHWHYFDVVETKFWDEPDFLDEYPTIFEILKKHNIDFDTIGWSGRVLNKSLELIEDHNFIKLADWTYIFVGDIDPLSHVYGQESPTVKAKLRHIDRILMRIYNKYKNESDDVCFMLFSDHGHIMAKNKLNLSSVFKTHGRDLTNYIYFVDSNYARFWFRNETERNEIYKILLSMNNEGFILTDELLEKHNVNMPDNRYGDLIFYLDAPNVFDQGNIFLMGKERSDSGKYISFHGYLPEYSESDGVFISNKELINDTYIRLEDIMPSILYLFGLEIPEHVDGKVIWK